MSGKSPASGPSFGALYALLYLFTAGAVAINLFMLGLLGQAIGLRALTPMVALALAGPLAVPVNWLVSRWVSGLIQQADGKGR